MAAPGVAPRELARVLAARGGDPRVRVMAASERWPVPAATGGGPA